MWSIRKWFSDSSDFVEDFVVWCFHDLTVRLDVWGEAEGSREEFRQLLLLLLLISYYQWLICTQRRSHPRSKCFFSVSYLTVKYSTGHFFLSVRRPTRLLSVIDDDEDDDDVVYSFSSWMYPRWSIAKTALTEKRLIWARRQFAL